MWNLCKRMWELYLIQKLWHSFSGADNNNAIVQRFAHTSQNRFIVAIQIHIITKYRYNWTIHAKERVKLIQNIKVLG